VDEMELRIETQKQTLCARDESMRKLLEMLQSKGLSVQKIEDNQQEVEHLQTRQLEDDRKIKQLQNTLGQKESVKYHFMYDQPKEWPIQISFLQLCFK
jgi:ELKS/RAB6-interacting/CAST family protein 1